MTVVVAFLCSDGVVVAADSMLTPFVGNMGVGHHKGKKVDVLTGTQVFSFAGDLGQASRFKIVADASHAQITAAAHPIHYPLNITQQLIAQFQVTGILGAINLSTILAYPHAGKFQCCVFESLLQPRLLDHHHYYVALGSGKLGADPFLRFLVDTFCENGPPTVREAVFLATWAVQHVIDTNAGGVDGPIRIAVLEKDGAGNFVGRELQDTEIDTQQEVVTSAKAALKEWKNGIYSGRAAEGVPPPPSLPLSSPSGG